MAAFGAYGFCRAHAVAFAVPALQSAWLKAHHPAALYAGLLEHDPGMWPARVIVADARRHDVPILTVDINTSQAQYTVERTGSGWGVRIFLSTVHGISDDEVARMIAGQPYTSLQDLYAAPTPSSPPSNASSASAPSTNSRAKQHGGTYCSRQPRSTVRPAPDQGPDNCHSTPPRTPPERPGCER